MDCPATAAKPTNTTASPKTTANHPAAHLNFIFGTEGTIYKNGC